MSLRLSLQNFARGAAVTAPASFPGYPSSALVDGLLAVPYRGLTAAATWSFDVDIGTAQAVDFLALFDLRVLTAGVGVSSVMAYHLSTGFPITAGTLALSVRGDGSVALPVPIVERKWRIVVALSAPGVIHMGEVWVGRYRDCAKHVSALRAQPERGVVVNGDFARLVEPMRERFTLTWSALDAAQHVDLRAIDAATDGELAQVVLVPDSGNPAGVYHGRIGALAGYSLDPSWLYQGHEANFAESRRCL